MLLRHTDVQSICVLSQALSGSTRLIVATDVDGCLLSEDYSWAEASAALSALRRYNATLVLASSKTAAELRPLSKRLSFRSPLIVENGGALLLPSRYLDASDPETRLTTPATRMEFGTRHQRLLEVLRGIKNSLPIDAVLRNFAEMSCEEVMATTGLSRIDAKRARKREYDEPFLLAPYDLLPVVMEAAVAKGLRVTRGGRFLHLTGGTDKGRAFKALLDLHAAAGQSVVTVGIGDSENDAGLLKLVDVPIIIPRPDGQIDPTLDGELAFARRATSAGPSGWNEVVLDLLSEMR